MLDLLQISWLMSAVEYFLENKKVPELRVEEVSPVELMEVVVIMRRIDNTWEHAERITTHASTETQTSSHGH